MSKNTWTQQTIRRLYDARSSIEDQIYALNARIDMLHVFRSEARAKACLPRREGDSDGRFVHAEYEGVANGDNTRFRFSVWDRYENDRSLHTSQKCDSLPYACLEVPVEDAKNLIQTEVDQEAEAHRAEQAAKKAADEHPLDEREKAEFLRLKEKFEGA